MAGHGSRSVTVTVPKNASLLDAVFTAPASVGATLTNPSGETVATQVAGSAAAAQAVRALTAAKPAAGRWTITLRNTGPTPAPALLGAALSGGGVTLRTTAVRNTATRRLVVTARLLHNGRAQRGVTVLADIRGTRKPLPALRLYDDGKHHDGKRGDGVYGAATGKLPAGTYFVDVKATKRSTVRITSVLSS